MQIIAIQTYHLHSHKKLLVQTSLDLKVDSAHTDMIYDNPLIYFREEELP